MYLENVVDEKYTAAWTENNSTSTWELYSSIQYFVQCVHSVYLLCTVYTCDIQCVPDQQHNTWWYTCTQSTQHSFLQSGNILSGADNTPYN